MAVDECDFYKRKAQSLRDELEQMRRELSKQRDDARFDAEALRAKLGIVEKELRARLDRTPRARAFLATLLEVVRA